MTLDRKQYMIVMKLACRIFSTKLCKSCYLGHFVLFVRKIHRKFLSVSWIRLYLLQGGCFWGEFFVVVV